MELPPLDRRSFLAGALALVPAMEALMSARTAPWFEISLAQWSLHRTLHKGDLKALEFPGHARQRFGIEAVEYVNSFFKDKVTDEAWLKELSDRAKDAGVRNLLIMIDGEGDLGDPDDQKRTEAIARHRLWLLAAKALGCHSIRVNAASKGTREEQQKLAADGLGRLARLAEPLGLNVLVENHGGLSSDGAWLASVMRLADHPRLGTLPDFGNFNLGGGKSYDRYLGMQELMPFAKAVSAKSHDFDAEGKEVHTDYWRVLKIVKAAGYRGFIGVEYEGGKLSEEKGIELTRDLLIRCRRELSGD